MASFVLNVFSPVEHPFSDNSYVNDDCLLTASEREDPLQAFKIKKKIPRKIDTKADLIICLII